MSLLEIMPPFRSSMVAVSESCFASMIGRRLDDVLAARQCGGRDAMAHYKKHVELEDMGRCGTSIN